MNVNCLDLVVEVREQLSSGYNEIYLSNLFIKFLKPEYRLLMIVIE